MIDTLVPLVLLLLLGYSIHRYVRYYGTGHRQSELPVHRRSLSTTHSAWTIERDGLTLSLSTTGLNGVPARLIDRRSETTKKLLRGLYDAGSVFGVLGGFGAVCTAVWTLSQVWLAVWEEAQSHAAQPEEPLRMIKRTYEEDLVPAPQSGGLQPLIPGVSLPWSHLPALMLALLVNQLLHELGHATCAALDDIHPSRFCLKLNLVIPSMAVHLPASVDYLSPRAKMRIAASGPLHNLLMFLCLWVTPAWAKWLPLEYMTTVALSLYLFNLLPLPYTDGSQLLKALLSLQVHQTTVSLRSSSHSRPLTGSNRSATIPTINIRLASDRSPAYAYNDDIDDIYDSQGEEWGGEEDRREEAWKRRLRRGVEGGVLVLGAGWLAGWAMLMLLRSS